MVRVTAIFAVRVRVRDGYIVRVREVRISGHLTKPSYWLPHRKVRISFTDSLPFRLCLSASRRIARVYSSGPSISTPSGGPWKLTACGASGGLAGLVLDFLVGGSSLPPAMHWVLQGVRPKDLSYRGCRIGRAKDVFTVTERGFPSG